MLSNMAKNLKQRGLMARAMQARAFSSNSVTYDVKDLIIDPERKGQ